MPDDPPPEPPVLALLIEDDPGDARLVTDMLEHADERVFEVTWAQTLDAAERQLADHWDVILLDLNLPDSRGLATIDAVRERAQDDPIVVLTGIGDPAAGIDAMSRGAQDYLVKGRFDPRALERSIRYAIIRHEVAKREARLREGSRREMVTLLTVPNAPMETAVPPGPLRERDPGLFEKLAGEFSTIVHRDVEAIARKGRPRGEDWAQKAGRELASAVAGPRDVIDLYLATARALAARAATPDQKEAFEIEARLRALELMGHLASRYRGVALTRLRPAGRGVDG